MKVTQLADLVNEIKGEILGETALVSEDLSNIVDTGKEFMNVADGLENAMRKLHDKVGRTIVVSREWRGTAPDILRDGWEFGSILEKITPELPVAEENESWQLVDGSSYDQNIYTMPKASAKYWNGLKTFEIPMSRAESQIKSAFNSAQSFFAFWSGIEVYKRNAMRIYNDGLIYRVLNNFAAETIYADYGTGSISGSSGVKAVNLLYLYNTLSGTTLTAAKALYDTDFLKFAVTTIQRYITRMSKPSTLFNIGGTPKQTLRDDMHVVLHADFISAADNYLQADTFHNTFTSLPFHDTVSAWQGTGDDFSFTDSTSIKVTTSEGHTINVSGVIGMMFDRDALAVTNQNYRVTGHFNAKAEFFNSWDKWEANYINDFNENFVVFLVA